MSQNLVHKILADHLVSGELVQGEEIEIKIDQTLMHDGTGQMATLQFEAIGLDRVKTDLSVTYTDHNTLQVAFMNMDDHHFLASSGRKFGIHYSKAGNGICHQVHLERFSKPGNVLLGADSHTTTSGGVGMLAIGAGGLNIAAAMAGLPFTMVVPKVVKVELKGCLPVWSSAKDLALEILRSYDVSGGRGRILEFVGEGVSTLSATERATITNMSLESGAMTSIFPSDGLTKRYFKAQKREKDWLELSADPDAEYDEEIVIDMGKIEPMAAKPHSPGNVALVSELSNINVHQVAIGSCTNSSLQDMIKVASILKGHRVPSEMSLVIAPGSRQVLRALTECGALADMIAAGARIAESTCGFCVGVGQAPRSEGVSVRTSNRNFPGRSGTKDAQVYLVSPETAAATALSGKLTDPRTLGEPASITLPEVFPVDDSMIIQPAPQGEAVEIIRGPNIAPLPEFEPMQDVLEGPALLCLGDGVSTDDILPSGAEVFSLRANIPAISKYVFRPVDPDFHDRAKAAQTSFIIGGENFGQGSSREHAVLAPRYLGVRAVMAKSFARIFKSNLVNFGILPLEIEGDTDHIDIQQDHRIKIEGIHQALNQGSDITVHNLNTGKSFDCKIDLSSKLREILLEGGLLASIRNKI
ncbi:MAG: aconitate hydratase [Desulfobacterales bacterium]|nr:aconitate hydratase [Desulfobacterales bacterium]